MRRALEAKEKIIRSINRDSQTPTSAIGSIAVIQLFGSDGPVRPRWCPLLTTCGCDLPGISSRVDFGASLSVLGWGLAYGEEAYLLKQPSVGRSLLTRVQIAL